MLLECIWPVALQPVLGEEVDKALEQVPQPAAGETAAAEHEAAVGRQRKVRQPPLTGREVLCAMRACAWRVRFSLGAGRWELLTPAVCEGGGSKKKNPKPKNLKP